MLQKNNFYLYFSVYVVNLTSFVCGIGYAWSSTTLPKLNGQVEDASPLREPITIYHEAWLASLHSLSAAVTPFLTGACSARFGRKRTLLIFAQPLLVSNVCMIFAKSIELMYLARLFLGVGIGCVFSMIPVYTGEIAESRNRGSLILFMSIFMCSGSMFTYSLAPYISVSLMGCIATIPSISFIVLCALFVPESPYHSVSVRDMKTAERSLMRLRRKAASEVVKELLEIEKTVQEQKQQSVRVLSLFKDRILRKTLVITNVFFIFQQVSGITGIMGYLQLIFNTAGTPIPPHISVVFVSIVQLSTIVLTSQLIDRLGRKVLAYTSISGICVAHVSLGVYFYLKDSGFNVDGLFWLPLTSLMLCVFSYTFGLGPVAWTLVGELYPHNVKAIASTLTSSFALMIGFFVTQFWPIVVVMFGMSNLLFILAFCVSFGIPFVWYFVPETKGKSFQEIQDILRGTH